MAEQQAVLVIIDPLNAYLAGIDSHKAAEVRGGLAPLSALGERTGAAIVVVHHLNKGASTNALYRASGSLDFVAAARSVLGVAPDPEREGRMLLLPVKLNIAAKPPGLGFHRDDSGLVFDNEPVNLDAASAFSAAARRDSPQMVVAKTFLRRVLGSGEAVAQKLVEAEAQESDISLATLRRAKKSLGVHSERHDGIGQKGVWYWRLEPE